MNTNGNEPEGEVGERVSGEREWLDTCEEYY